MNTLPRSASSGITILLIDDEDAMLLALSTIVKKAGYNVLKANNGIDALRLAEEHLPNLIICDVTMPFPNGFELRELLSDNPSTRTIPFIFLTSKGSDADKLKGLELGADDYITKPFKRQELLARIKALLRRVSWEHEKEKSAAEGEIKRFSTEILRNVSHELRTPLSVILQALELELMSRQSEFIQTIFENAHHLKRVINDLITLTQLDQGMVSQFRQPIDLELDFHALTEKYQLYEKKVEFKVLVDSDVKIYAPRNEFQQAVEHLIDNAVKFSPEDGIIMISLAANGVGGCHLTITNRGVTIPPELREKVFERFYQVSQGLTREYTGLGVGLTIARAFARSLGGDVLIIDNEPILGTDSGCSVRMTIPPKQ